MSLVDTFHRAHLERQLRIKSAALRHLEAKQSLPKVVVKAAPKPVAPVFRVWPRKVRSKYRIDKSYERAWCITLLDFEPSKEVAMDHGRVEEIQRAVCEHYGISLPEMISKNRIVRLSLPRHVAVYLALKLTKKSYPDLGRRFGGRDHSTQIHAVKRVKRLIDTDEEVCASVEMLTEHLGGDIA